MPYEQDDDITGLMAVTVYERRRKGIPATGVFFTHRFLLEMALLCSGVARIFHLCNLVTLEPRTILSHSPPKFEISTVSAIIFLLFYLVSDLFAWLILSADGIMRVGRFETRLIIGKSCLFVYPFPCLQLTFFIEDFIF